MTFTLDAPSLTHWQDCRRRYLLGAEWQAVRWRPKTLLDACLRRGVYELSNGADVEAVVVNAQTYLMEAAADPGLDVQGYPPYPLAKDLTSALETILRSVARLVLLTLHDVAPVRLNSQMEWRPLAWADDSGELHRYITVDRLTEDRIAAACHGWSVIGDIAATGCPMTLHIVEIGQQRRGRYTSAWTRAFRHPAMPSLGLRFNKKDGTALTRWQSVYLADMPAQDPKEWVDRMWAEGAAQKAMHHFGVEVPGAQVIQRTLSDIMYEGVRMREAQEDAGAVPWSSLPMSRKACDAIGNPCVFQSVCYAPDIVPVDSLGLYTRRSETKVLALR